MGFKQTVCLITVSGMLAGAVFAAESKITISAENRPLGEVLENIQKTSGVQIELSDKKWANDPVSFSIKNSDIENALDSALKPYDYVLEWYATGNDFSKVVVTVHERKRGTAGAVAYNPPVLPDVQAAVKREPLDYSKISAFPPRPNGEKGMSVAELRESLVRVEKNVDQEAVSAFPPGGIGEGISAADLSRCMMSNKSREEMTNE